MGWYLCLPPYWQLLQLQQAPSFPTLLIFEVNMGWFQLLLLSLEQNTPRCTVLLFCLSSLMPPGPFNVKPLRNVGYEMLCMKRNSSTKKFKVLWYCRTKKKLNLPSFLYSQQQLWVGRTKRRKRQGLTPGGTGLSSLVPFWKSTRRNKALPGQEVFLFILKMKF